MRVHARVYVLNNEEFVDNCGALPDGRRVRYESLPHVADHLVPNRELLKEYDSIHIAVRLFRAFDEVVSTCSGAKRARWMFAASEVRLPGKVSDVNRAEVAIEETGDVITT